MQQAPFYHFLKTKEEEEENVHDQNPGVHYWEVIEKRSDAPKLLELFPWEIKKILKASDLSPKEGLELSFIEAWDNIVQHLENLVAKNMIDHRDQVPINIQDMDTNTEHDVSLRKAADSNKFYIQGGWFPNFVARRNLRVGSFIGLYQDNKSLILRFSVLDND